MVPIGSIVPLTISGSVDAGLLHAPARTPSAAALTLSVSWQVSSSSASDAAGDQRRPPGRE